MNGVRKFLTEATGRWGQCWKKIIKNQIILEFLHKRSKMRYKMS